MKKVMFMVVAALSLQTTLAFAMAIPGKAVCNQMKNTAMLKNTNPAVVYTAAANPVNKATATQATGRN